MKLLYALALITVALGISTGYAKDDAHPQANNETSKIETLGKKADDHERRIKKIESAFSNLREENRNQRRLLAKGKNAQSTTNEIIKETKGQKTGEHKYWLTTSSKKRHGPACRYYEKSKGRYCTKDEGTPCKICGGE